MFYRLEKTFCEPSRFCLARNFFFMPRVLVVKTILFTTPEKTFILIFCFALYFRIQRCPTCNAVRRARGKTFFREAIGATLNFFFLKHRTPGEEKNYHPDKKSHDRVQKLP